MMMMMVFDVCDRKHLLSLYRFSNLNVDCEEELERYKVDTPRKSFNCLFACEETVYCVYTFNSRWLMLYVQWWETLFTI